MVPTVIVALRCASELWKSLMPTATESLVMKNAPQPVRKCERDVLIKQAVAKLVDAVASVGVVVAPKVDKMVQVHLLNLASCSRSSTRMEISS